MIQTACRLLESFYAFEMLVQTFCLGTGKHFPFETSSRNDSACFVGPMKPMNQGPQLPHPKSGPNRITDSRVQSSHIFLAAKTGNLFKMFFNDLAQQSHCMCRLVAHNILQFSSCPSQGDSHHSVFSSHLSSWLGFWLPDAVTFSVPFLRQNNVG